MRYSDWQQRQMDIEYGLKLDAQARQRAAKPCKNEGNSEVNPIDGSCLRCGADQGETCR